MKKLLLFVFTLVFVLGILSACSGGEEAASESSSDDSSSDQKSDFPSEPVNVIVAYDAGGGTDTTARALQPYLEDELGVPVNVINKPGGTGWVGWTSLANAKPDGQTIGYLN